MRDSADPRADDWVLFSMDVKGAHKSIRTAPDDIGFAVTLSTCRLGASVDSSFQACTEDCKKLRLLAALTWWLKHPRRGTLGVGFLFGTASLGDPDPLADESPVGPSSMRCSVPRVNGSFRQPATPQRLSNRHHGDIADSELGRSRAHTFFNA